MRSRRSLAACEGSILVVDASQGVEAQTLANVYQAIDNNHEIVPVLNKIDLPAAEPDRVRQQIEDVIGLDASDAVLTSAKTGARHPRACWRPSSHRLPAAQGRRRRAAEGAAGRRLVRRLPRRGGAGPGDRRHAAQAGQRVQMMQQGSTHLIDRHRRLQPQAHRGRRASAPARSASSPPRSRKWPTPPSATPSPTRRRPAAQALPGFRDVQPVVFCGLFPVDAADFEDLRAAIGRLRLNDASFSYEMET